MKVDQWFLRVQGRRKDELKESMRKLKVDSNGLYFGYDIGFTVCIFHWFHGYIYLPKLTKFKLLMGRVYSI